MGLHKLSLNLNSSDYIERNIVVAQYSRTITTLKTGNENTHIAGRPQKNWQWQSLLHCWSYKHNSLLDQSSQTGWWERWCWRRRELFLLGASRSMRGWGFLQSNSSDVEFFLLWCWSFHLLTQVAQVHLCVDWESEKQNKWFQHYPLIQTNTQHWCHDNYNNNSATRFGPSSMNK